MRSPLPADVAHLQDASAAVPVGPRERLLVASLGSSARALLHRAGRGR